MFRHIVEKHLGIDPDKIEFKMRVLTNHKSAFKRQLREAVMIEHFAGPLILNNKMEYNRCSIPKFVMKLGDAELQEDPKITNERSTIEKIKLLLKGENKRQIRDHENVENEEMMKTGKRQKLEETEGSFGYFSLKIAKSVKYPL